MLRVVLAAALWLWPPAPPQPPPAPPSPLPLPAKWAAWVEESREKYGLRAWTYERR